MRGREKKQRSMFTVGDIHSLVEERISPDHPIRRIKQFTDQVLASLSDEFDALYAAGGRPSIPHGAIAASVVVAGDVLDSKRATVGGVRAVRLALSLVRRIAT
jgi:hypothetical protein